MGKEKDKNSNEFKNGTTGREFFSVLKNKQKTKQRHSKLYFTI